MATDVEGSQLAPNDSKISRQSGRRRRAGSSSCSVDLPDSEDSSTGRNLSRSSIDAMYRFSTPDDQQLKYTRTGRISKATKGERVHACEECGKVYTRAEHLRRHVKNHNPGNLPCDVPDCGKSFFREDLLQRHKQRHIDSSGSFDRRASTDDQTSRRGSTWTETSANGSIEYSETRVAGRTIVGNLAADDVSMRYTYDSPALSGLFHGASRMVGSSDSKDYTSIDEAYPLATSSTAEFTSLGAPQWQRNSSAVRGVSPAQPYYGAGRHASLGQPINHEPHHYHDASRSSTSFTSGRFPISTPGKEKMDQAFAGDTPSSDMSAEPSGAGQINALDPNLKACIDTPPQLISPEERDLLEQMHLQTPVIGMAALDFEPHISAGTMDVEERYLNTFWQTVHPLWPIVHRPTFDILTASPLLKAALIALGAQGTGDLEDISNARVLHERCVKVLKKRTINNTHSYRVCDMQAIALLELYAIYKSRRPPLQLSRCFSNVFRTVAADTEAYPSPDPETFNPALHFSDVQRESKRRLLIACYILDRQHSSFFGRPSMDCLTIPVEYLPFPLPLYIWDGTTVPPRLTNNTYGQPATDLQVHEYTYEALNAISYLRQHSPTPYDSFRSSYLTAVLKDVRGVQTLSIWRPMDDAEESALLHVVDHTPQTQLAYHTFMLCKNTPVRHLLAVAGESWVLAEKITSKDEYSAAQIETRDWVDNSMIGSNHMHALYHALHIMSIYRNSTTPGVLFRDWAVHLATLVIWITSYVTQHPSNRQRLHTSSPFSRHDLEGAVTAVIEAGPSAAITWANTSSILLWTQDRLQQMSVPQSSGLVRECLDVLNKLISRGHEGTWLR